MSEQRKQAIEIFRALENIEHDEFSIEGKIHVRVDIAQTTIRFESDGDISVDAMAQGRPHEIERAFRQVAGILSEVTK